MTITAVVCCVGTTRTITVPCTNARCTRGDAPHPNEHVAVLEQNNQQRGGTAHGRRSPGRCAHAPHPHPRSLPSTLPETTNRTVGIQSTQRTRFTLHAPPPCAMCQPFLIAKVLDQSRTLLPYQRCATVNFSSSS
jgi:hypothetical protein